MWNRLTQTVAPASSPVTLAETKLHLRVRPEDVEEDALIQRLIDAAVSSIDGPSGVGIAMVTQTWEMDLDFFPTWAIELPLVPALSVVSLKYYDTDGVQQTLTVDDDYQVDVRSRPARITPAPSGTFPSTQVGKLNAVTVNATFGYATVPALLKSAVLLTVGHLYENRESVIVGTIASTLPQTAQDILNKYAVGRVG